MAGWIKIYRQIENHWVWQNEVYLKAWLTILLNVNYEDKRILISGELIECTRGQSLMSLKSWANLFGKKWTIQKVRTFFELLESDSMINTTGLRKTTRLTVINYDSYQNEQQGENTETILDVTRRQHGDNTEITTTKERKEIKKERSNKREYKNILLSEIEISDFPELKIEHLEIAKGFQELFRSNLQEAGSPTKIIENAKSSWIDDIRLMLESDKVTVGDMREVFQFLKKDAFWKQNILSTKKLRDKFPTLKMKIHAEKSTGGSGQNKNNGGARLITDDYKTGIVARILGNERNEAV
jgi:hypothetical protein